MMMKAILGGSLVVVGLMAAVGGTSGFFTTPLVAGISLLQVGGALVTLLGVAVLVGIDPLSLKSDVSGASVV
ncbi:MAG: hypothetical protein ACTSPB_02900 [Candidatus Thorarchaeota archaeon]